MTTTEAHHEIARSVKVLGDLDVSPKHKFLLKAHCEKILEHALAMRRCRDNLDRAREAKRVELFARAARAGWDVWGDEVEGSIAMPGSISMPGHRENITPKVFTRNAVGVQ